MTIEIAEVIGYLERIPTPASYQEMDESDAEMAVFDAMETIISLYPKIDLTPRMVALQVRYVIEGEDEGVAMMRRQGIKDYTVKDVKAVLDSRDLICPETQSLINAALEELDPPKKRGGRWGRMI